jgi:ribonuclease HI
MTGIDLTHIRRPKPGVVHIYSDGSSIDRGLRRFGGYAALLLFTDAGRTLHHRVVSGFVAGATANQMELWAAVCGLRAITRRCNVVVFSDSRYVTNGGTHWVKLWQKTGYTTKSAEPVKNAELWKALAAEKVRHGSVTFQWVKGHSGVVGNTIADKIAQAMSADAAALSDDAASQSCEVWA